MTKDEYLKLKTKPFSEWTRQECIQADSFIKDVALTILAANLKPQPKVIQDYVNLMARCHYGSIETDEFLKALNCYPDWM